jgi:hypothetical protein
MTVTFNLNEAEINDNFILYLKNLFKNRDLNITIQDSEEQTKNEDEALGFAIEEGLTTETISKDDLIKALNES